MIMNRSDSSDKLVYKCKERKISWTFFPFENVAGYFYRRSEKFKLFGIAVAVADSEGESPYPHGFGNK